MDEKDKLIATQAQVIANLMKVGALNQALVTKVIDALRLYLLDMSSLMLAIGQTPPPVQDLFKGLKLVPDLNKDEPN
jgi:hypothetical protein